MHRCIKEVEMVYGLIDTENIQEEKRHADTHLLKDIVELLQRGPDSSVTAYAACIAIEVNAGHSVQSVMTKGTDHRGTHRPPIPVRDLIDRRLIQIGIIASINLLPSF